MATISDSMTMVSWLHAKCDPIIDYSDDFVYATLLQRGVDDDSATVGETTERVRDLCLADMYLAAAISSTKTGTNAEADGGWSHYVAVKNVVSRPALLDMAKALYAKWGETFTDPSAKLRMKSLY